MMSERFSYQPEPHNLNDGMTDREREDFREFMSGYDDTPFAYGENGDLVQPDRPMMPEDLEEWYRR